MSSQPLSIELVPLGAPIILRESTSMISAKYYVERIVDRKVDESTQEPLYLIKWLGYSDKRNSWEDKNTLKDYASMIEIFEKKLAKAEGSAGQQGADGGIDESARKENSAGVEAAKENKGQTSGAEAMEIESGDSKQVEKAEPSKDAGQGSSGSNQSPSDDSEDKIIVPFRFDDPLPPMKDGFPVRRDGEVPEMIYGTLKDKDEIRYVVKWRGTNEGAIVPSEEAHFKWPDLVMKFFEERLQLKKKEEEK